MTSEVEDSPMKLRSGRSTWTVAAILLCLAVLLPPAAARDKTAHITLEKGRAPGNIFHYQVKPGDKLGAILKQQLGNIPRDMRPIRELNPHIRDINRIYPGQTIALPQVSPEQTESKDDNTYYVVAKGDSLSSILKRKLYLTGADLKHALKLTKEMNPALKDLNQIYPGQKILLPVAKGPSPAPAKETCLAGICGAREAATAAPPRAETIGILEAILERMDAKLINDGTYHLPLSGIGNFAIDNSVIPQIEFADGSVAFLDFNRRIPDHIRDSMAQNWPDITVVQPEDRATIPRILEKIFTPKRAYQFQRLDQPLVIGSPAQVEIQADCLIGWPRDKESSPRRQAIILVKDPAHLLPRTIRLFTEKTGLIITEVVSGRVAPQDAPLPDDLKPVAYFAGNTNLDLVRNFLKIVGLKPTEAAEVSLFDPAQDGFKLSFNADLLVAIPGHQVIFHARPLSPPFISRLSERGYQVVIIGNEVTKSDALQKTMAALQLPFSSGTFSFSLPGKPEGQINRISFPAIKITLEKKDSYLIDFGLDPYLHAYLVNQWRLNLIKY